LEADDRALHLSVLLEPLLPYLFEHPLIGVALCIVLISALFTLIKKLFKIALVLSIVFLASSGILFHFSQEELAQKGKKTLQSIENKVRKTVKETLPALYPDTTKKK